MPRMDKMEALKQRLFLSMSPGVILITGMAGTGKTTTGVAIAYNLREILGKTVLLDFIPKKSFGPYQHVNTKKVISAFKNLNKVVKRATKRNKSLSVHDIAKIPLKLNVANTVIFLDEAYSYFESRSPNKKDVKLFSYMVDQHRHYLMTLIVISPDKSRLDQRLRGQVTHEVRCRKWGDTIIARVEDLRTADHIRIRIPGKDYWKMFESYNALQVRTDVLDIGA